MDFIRDIGDWLVRLFFDTRECQFAILSKVLLKVSTALFPSDSGVVVLFVPVLFNHVIAVEFSMYQVRQGRVAPAVSLRDPLDVTSVEPRGIGYGGPSWAAVVRPDSR